jgi:uncharacterized repeat protein (TIGR01451 family)
MKNSSNSSPIRRLARRLLVPVGSLARGALFLLVLTFVPEPSQSAAPPAGTSIGNQASATYTDASNTPRTATSNVAITIVQQVASFTLTSDGQARYAAPGGQVYFPHTIKNTGNGTDTFNITVENAASGDDFNLNSLAAYADANGDGVPDNTTAITSSGQLAADASFQFVVVGIVPGAQSPADAAILRVIAEGTATATPAAAQTNSDTVTVTADAVVNMTKAMSANSGAAGSGPHTVTLTYNNTGNNTATNVTLMDAIPAGMVYVTNSARWSVTGSGTALTDATGDDQGAAPDAINYDYGETQAGRVTATIRRVQPGQSGNVTFEITIATNQPAGAIYNTATYQYDPGTGTTNAPVSGNTVIFTVTRSLGVDITGATVALAAQGATVVFTNVVVNTGNASDTFNISVTNSTFPAGTTFTLYQSDGNTPLVDSNGDGTPDTGPLSTNQSYNVILKATLPTGSSGNNVNYTAIIAATSTTDSSTTDSANDVLTSVTGNTVDLSNGASGGAGAGPEADPVVLTSANPGTTTRFTLYATNTSGVADIYNLSVSTNSTFGTVGVPAGWTVVFRDSSEAIITSTGVILAGTNKLFYADVTVPATNAPGTNHLYFRVLSPTTTASDILHDALAVNTVRSLSLSPNNTGQITPGGSVVYSHLLQNNGNVLEGDGTVSTISLTLGQNLAGWSAVVYYDGNNNGIVDTNDAIVTDLSFTSGSAAGLAPSESVRLLVKVFAPPGAPVGAINTTTLTATTANGTYGTTVPAVVTASDNSTVISGDLQLLKEQALDADLDGTPDTAYGSGDITTGAVPGKGIRYRITVTNNGSAPATQVKVYDHTPAYTVYTTTVAAATTVGSVTTQ